ncbi:MAG: ABC transporter ATP-binding protein [Candidatus Aminicenantia bacterium]
MLEIKGLCVKIGNFLLDNISLNIKDNECHVIIGPTGSGKTTLIESILGLRKPLKGEILLNGRSITELPVEKRGFSYLPQDLALFPNLYVEDNIYYSLKIRKVKDNGYKEQIQELIKTVGIEHLLKRQIKGLSGGERQKVALVRAIASGSKYLILDEPLSALHEGLKKELWFLLKELKEKFKLTIIMITHDIEEAFFLADTITVMIDGKIHQSGINEEVFHRPRTLEVARFFGINNLFEAKIVESYPDGFKIFCPQLNATLNVRRSKGLTETLENRRRLIAGIRAEDVIILRPDLPVRQDNLFNASVTAIYSSGPYFIVMVQPDMAYVALEIKIPEYAFAKLNLNPSSHITLSLRSERIFLLE